MWELRISKSLRHPKKTIKIYDLNRVIQNIWCDMTGTWHARWLEWPKTRVITTLELLLFLVYSRCFHYGHSHKANISCYDLRLVVSWSSKSKTRSLIFHYSVSNISRGCSDQHAAVTFGRDLFGEDSTGRPGQIVAARHKIIFPPFRRHSNGWHELNLAIVITQYIYTKHFHPSIYFTIQIHFIILAGL